jgi:signal transduction histidine kinase
MGSLAMTGILWLDWAILAMSLFNTVLQLWLGLTVLLNAERRSWGIWLAAGGLLMGSIFFLSHSAILGHGLADISLGMNIWWRTGWLPVLCLPFAWYLVILWYGGFWESRSSRLHRRQRPWLAAMSAILAALVGLLLFDNPLPSLTQLAALDLNATLSLAGLPLLILIYPIYILLCNGLALGVLRQPGPTERWSGAQARLRARPWLFAASFDLLVVGLLVGWIMVWIIIYAQRGIFTQQMASLVGLFDLLIAGLIAVAVLLLGQALVAYELFTGKSLPRRGLVRYWRRAIILAAGYGVIVAGSQVLGLRSIYSLLLSTILMTVFFAMLGWRAYAEQDRLFASLRPFVTSSRMYERLTSQAGVYETLDNQPEIDVDVLSPFRALCADVLGARSGSLIALGPLAPFSGRPLSYPDPTTGSGVPLAVSELAERFESPNISALPLEEARYGGAIWAVPLWGERGLTGLFLLGAKLDGGLYTQEEIEIARLAGERLIDAQAGAEMARRLMSLQRQHLAQSQVLDQQTKRTLHDDVLPHLHTAMLNLSSADFVEKQAVQEIVDQLTDIHRSVSNLLRAMPSSQPDQLARLGLAGALRSVLENELAGVFKQISLDFQPEALEVFQKLPAFMGEVLFYAAREAIRNAANHAQPSENSRPLELSIRFRLAGGLELLVEDNGCGITHIQPGVPAPVRNSGQGLVLHSTMMAVIGGSMALESELGESARVRLFLPVSHAEKLGR